MILRPVGAGQPPKRDGVEGRVVLDAQAQLAPHISRDAALGGDAAEALSVSEFVCDADAGADGEVQIARGLQGGDDGALGPAVFAQVHERLVPLSPPVDDEAMDELGTVLDVSKCLDGVLVEADVQDVRIAQGAPEQQRSMCMVIRICTTRNRLSSQARGTITRFSAP